MKFRIFFAATFAVFFTTAVVATERVAILCIGEQKAACAPNTTLHVGCGAKAEAVGKTFCTIQTKDGPQVMPHFVDAISNYSGNKCGYYMVKITCHIP